MLFRLSSFALVMFLVIIIGAAIAIGNAIGRRGRSRSDSDPEHVSVVQGTLLGLVGLLLAFGLSMAVGRYDARRSLVVQEANTIGTTYLRAQLLQEPERSDSLTLLRSYTEHAVDLSKHVPYSDQFQEDTDAMEETQGDLWRLAGEAIARDPQGTAPRLYAETLNETIDTHTERVSSLKNRVPAPVVYLLVFGSAVALGALSVHMALLGRGAGTSLLAASVLVLILYVSFDLDRPNRGLIEVPSTPLENVAATMNEPPVAGG